MTATWTHRDRCAGDRLGRAPAGRRARQSRLHASDCAAVRPEPREVVLDDYNGDGFIDIVTGNGGDATISVVTNNGTGTFTEAARLNDGRQPARPADEGPRRRRTARHRVRRGRDRRRQRSQRDISAHRPARSAGRVKIIPANAAPFHGAADLRRQRRRLHRHRQRYRRHDVRLRGPRRGGFGQLGNYTLGTPSNTLTVGDVNGDSRPDILVARATRRERCRSSSIAAAPRLAAPTFRW